jgi:hypothetical protein
MEATGSSKTLVNKITEGRNPQDHNPNSEERSHYVKAGDSLGNLIPINLFKGKAVPVDQDLKYAT